MEVTPRAALGIASGKGFAIPTLRAFFFLVLGGSVIDGFVRGAVVWATEERGSAYTVSCSLSWGFRVVLMRVLKAALTAAGLLGLDSKRTVEALQQLGRLGLITHCQHRCGPPRAR